eukprot:gene6245-7238_t
MGASESKFKNRAFSALSSGTVKDATFVKKYCKKIKKLDINVSDSLGSTLLSRATALGRRPIVMELLDLGANINRANNAGVAPIHLAVANGDDEMTVLLLRSGANPNVLSDASVTPLITAVRNGDEKFVELLFGDHRADHAGCMVGNAAQLAVDVNMPDKQKMTALMWAASEGNDSLVRFLLHNGADVNRRDATGRTALFIAKSASHHTTVTILNDHFCKVNKIPKLVSSASNNSTLHSLPNNTISNHQQQLSTNNQSASNLANGATNASTVASNQQIHQVNHTATDSLASSWSSTDSVLNPPTTSGLDLLATTSDTH